MSDAVLVAVIGASQAVVLAIVGPTIAVLLRRIRVAAQETRAQVVNDHKTNLREENDGRHAETLELFAEVRRDIGGLRSDVRRMGTRLTTLEQLEITEPRPRR